MSSLEDIPDVILYTDGACSGNPGPGGWAAILKHPATGQSKRLSGGEQDTTNNRMELQAVIEGLRSLRPEKCCRVHVVSDSEYVLKGLSEWMGNWIRHNWRRGKKPNSPPVKNADLWQALHELTQQHEMSYEHVAGHSGHPENEECDRMAVGEIEKIVPGHGPDAKPTQANRRRPDTRVPVRRVFTGAPWEEQIGFCRAIRVGDRICVTGTAPIDDDGNTFAPGDAYAQARRCLEIIERSLVEVDASMADVVRTRMFVTDISRWAEYGRAHHEFFAEHAPATTMVEVKSLIASDMLIEIEAEAICLNE